MLSSSNKRRRGEPDDGVADPGGEEPADPGDPPARTPAVAADPALSAEQQAVLKAVRDGENIFLTGSAGVGKSVTLRAIIRTLGEMYEPGHVAVCASTGIAAEPLGGSTLHSFAGCAKGEYYRNFLNVLSRDNRSRIVKCAALVIDGACECERAS